MKILVIRFSSIGDIVLTFPVLAAIKHEFPQAEIHYATKKTFEELLRASAHIDRVHLLSDSFPAFKRELKSESFDVVIDLHNNLRSKRLTTGLSGKKVRFSKLNFKKWLFTTLKWNTLPHVHIVERYLATLKVLSIDSPIKENKCFIIPEESQVNMADSYPSLGKSFVAIAIGAQFQTKRVPKEKWVEILRKTHDSIVVLGGKMDREMATWIMQQLPEKNIENACGEWSILQSSSIVSQAKSVLTNDTGMMHIAACFDVQIISIWGNTVPAFGMYPFRPNGASDDYQFEVKGISCRPCSKIGFESCPKKHFACMNQQNAAEIAASIKEN